MSTKGIPDNLTVEQAEAIERAAYGIIQAREQAAQIVKDAGIDFGIESPFASMCGAMLPPPRQHQRCLCSGYKGDGVGPCINTFSDDGGPDFGEGPPRRPCRHKPSEHDIHI